MGLFVYLVFLFYFFHEVSRRESREPAKLSSELHRWNIILSLLKLSAIEDALAILILYRLGGRCRTASRGFVPRSTRVGISGWPRGRTENNYTSGRWRRDAYPGREMRHDWVFRRSASEFYRSGRSREICMDAKTKIAGHYRVSPLLFRTRPQFAPVKIACDA